MREFFLPVKGYGYQYLVSNMGRIATKERGKNKYYRIMHPWKDRRGYLCVELDHKFYRVHRVVAQRFIPNPENKYSVNHKDENKENNRVDNLEWMTLIENARYGTRDKRATDPLKKPILRIDKETGKVLQRYASVKEAANAGYSHCGIRCCANHYKGYQTSYGYKWEWEKDYATGQ